MTPIRSDHQDDMIPMLLGPLLHRSTAREQADELIAENQIRNEHTARSR